MQVVSYTHQSDKTMAKIKTTVIQGLDDNSKLKVLRKMAADSKKVSVRERVCFQIESQQMLRMLQTQDMGFGIAEKLELHPFSFEELWAQRLFVTLPRRRVVSSPLDWNAITYDSPKRVHLVVVGLNSMTEAIIRQACLLCHFPNFVRDNSCKTCITIIDPTLKEDDNLLLRRYGVLMDNCRWSFVNHFGCISQHFPDYSYLGGEYTDVEFRLVSSEATGKVARMMLSELAKDSKELPSIVFGDENGERNWDLATGLPTEYYVEGCNIPIYVRMKSSAVIDSATMLPQYCNIKPFGMDDCEFDLSLPLTQMAMGVAYLYDRCFATGETHCDSIDREKAAEIWNRSKSINRFSSETNAMTIITKLRSLGKQWNDKLTDEEVALLSEVEHNRWSVERLLAGVRPVTPEEQKEIDNDRSLKAKMRDRGAHYDLRPYSALKEDFNGHNVQVYDECLVRGLQAIVRAFEESDNGPELMTVKREYHATASRIKNIFKWTGIIAFVTVMLMGMGFLLIDHQLESMAKNDVGQYVYKLRIDSIEIWNGNQGIDTVLVKKSDNDVGTAFAADGVGIVTARHCVEYWLYDNLSSLSTPEEWSPEMRLAVDVETYNDTTKGEKKRMVSICSLIANDGELVMDRVAFEIDRSRDKVRRIRNGLWRYVIPVFNGDKAMMLSDYAVFRQPSTKGIRLAEPDYELKGNAFVLGYPRSSSATRVLECSQPRRVVQMNNGSIMLQGGTSHGISGGPVVFWNWLHFNFEAIGIMSRNDESGSIHSWATGINF